MKNNSNVLFNNRCTHTSVYLAGYVLESYIKILLINNGATKYKGNDNNSYGGHINSHNFLTRLYSINPIQFSNSILSSPNAKYPTNIINGITSDPSKSGWNINYRYDTDKWTDTIFASNIQDEIETINNEIINLRIDGVLQWVLYTN